MKKMKKFPNSANHVIKHRIYILDSKRLVEGITLPEWFYITKLQLTDLVQVGSVLMEKIDITITADMIECYQEVHIWESVEKQNNPQNLEYTAQEALSYSTGIQIMEIANESI